MDKKFTFKDINWECDIIEIKEGHSAIEVYSVKHQKRFDVLLPRSMYEAIDKHISEILEEHRKNIKRALGLEK